MIYSKKPLAQLIIHACKEQEIKHIIISPGSRNAPLSIGFYNDTYFNVLSIVDERSAGFFALGIAQQTQKTVALVCTSGSALLNYYPAIAEAFFSNIPLVVLSADRPEHLINIGDGQTINQKDVFRNHILKSIQLKENKIDWSLAETLTTLQLAKDQQAPVHLNIPFDEPLYDTVLEPINFHEEEKNISNSLLDEEPLNVDELEKFANIWNASKKKMVLIGVNFPSELMQTQINHLVKDPSVLVLTETTSNIYHKNVINGIDKLIAPLTNEELNNLKPEILLTFGGMVVSKKIKQFLRKQQPKQHWHVDKKTAYDTYFCLTHHFKVSAMLFFSQFFFLTKINKNDYQQQFLSVKEKRMPKHQNFIDKAPFSDLKVFDVVLRSIPQNSLLQLANSSVVRYTQLFNLDNTLSVFCNRGTSGIDGSTSTAIGAAYTTKKQTVFITGDISFFYDSNALWNNHIPTNFRIILINNAGGGIFRFINGPKSTNALPLFETTHNLDASHLCKMFNFEYEKVDDIASLTSALINFYDTNSILPKLLEIQTPKNENDIVLKEYFDSLS